MLKSIDMSLGLLWLITTFYGLLLFVGKETKRQMKNEDI